MDYRPRIVPHAHTSFVPPPTMRSAFADSAPFVDHMEDILHMARMDTDVAVRAAGGERVVVHTE